MKTKLIIGNADSVFIKDLTKEMKQHNNDIEIDVLATSKPQEKKLSGVNNVYSPPKFSSVFFVNVFSFIIYSYFLLLKKRKAYDSIDIHYVSTFFIFLMPMLKLSGKKVNAVIWGSDLFRCKQEWALKSILYYCDRVSCATLQLSKEVECICHSWGFKPNVTINKFGISTLSFLGQFDMSNVNEDNCYYYDEYQEKSRNITITIGYNAKPEQQHEKILQELCSLRDKDKYCFILPMTYGRVSDAYINQIRNIVSENNLNVIFLDKFMDEDELAYLINVTDIFVQMQTSDAFSATMQEHLFSGNRVITGSWLPYDELVDNGVKMSLLESFGEICSCIEDEHGMLTDADRNLNSNVVFKLSAFDSVIDGWCEL